MIFLYEYSLLTYYIYMVDTPIIITSYHCNNVVPFSVNTVSHMICSNVNIMYGKFVLLLYFLCSMDGQH